MRACRTVGAWTGSPVLGSERQRSQLLAHSLNSGIAELGLTGAALPLVWGGLRGTTGNGAGKDAVRKAALPALLRVAARNPETETRSTPS